MSDFDDLYQRWLASYRERLHGSVSELRIQEMAKAAALRGDEPPPSRSPKPFPIDAGVLGKQFEEAVNLSVIQKLRLWPGVGVVKGKVAALMGGNWRTTLLAAVTAALNYALVIVNNGTAVPQNSHDWLMLGLSAAIVGMGAVMKDAATGSQPGDPPTKARIAGALAQGEAVPSEQIVKAVAVSHEVDTLAALKDG